MSWLQGADCECGGINETINLLEIKNVNKVKDKYKCAANFSS